MYLRGVQAAVLGDIPLQDAEMPAADGVATVGALARMYGAVGQQRQCCQLTCGHFEQCGGLRGR